MSDTRLHEAVAVIGRKGTGKTLWFKRLAEKVYDLKRQPVIIIIGTDPVVLDGVTRVNSWDRLKTLKAGMVKFYDYGSKDDFAMLRQLMLLLKDGYFQGGAIFMDDCTNYVDSNPDRSVKRIIVDHRHYKTDLFMATHSLNFLPKFSRKMVSAVTIFKTLDNYDSAKDIKALDYPNPTAIYNAWQQVMAHPDPHFSLTVQTGQ